MDENERYVKERWDKAYEPIVQRGLMGIDIWVEGSRTYRFHADNLPAAWQAAFDFTKAREEEIRLLNRDIATIRVDLGFAKTDHTRGTYSRILAKLETALAELQRGMKAAR